jgi:hypothetical protein
MSGQVPADCCVEQLALGAGRRPFFCLGEAGFEKLGGLMKKVIRAARIKE